MRYHVNPKTGKWGQCRATVKPCSFGLGPDDHYETRAEAAAAYEKVMEKLSLPQVAKKEPTFELPLPEGFGKVRKPKGVESPKTTELKKDGLQQRELRRVAASTGDIAEVRFAALYGDDSVYRELLKRKSLEEAVLKHMATTAANKHTRELAAARLPQGKPQASQNRQASTVDAMTPERLQELMNARDIKPFEEYSATMPKKEALWAARNASPYSFTPRVLLTSANPQVDLEVKEEAFKHLPQYQLPQEVATSPHFPAAHFAAAMDSSQKREMAKHLSSLEDANALAKAVGEAWSAEGNKYGQDGILEQAAVATARSPHLSKGGREYLAKTVPAVASAFKLGALGARQGAEAAAEPEALRFREERGYGGPSEVIYHFDAEAVAAAGLEGQDIHTYLEHFRGIHLLGGSYEAKNGTYRGYIS